MFLTSENACCMKLFMSVNICEKNNYAVIRIDLRCMAYIYIILSVILNVIVLVI